MATVQSSRVTSGQPARAATPGVFHDIATYTIPATGDGSAANDIIQMIPVEKGTRVVGMTLTCEDVDTDGSPTVEFDVGDGDDVDRFIDGSTIGRTGGVATLGSGVAAAAADGVFYTYTADDTIDIKVVTAATAKAAGVITLCVLLSRDS